MAVSFKVPSSPKKDILTIDNFLGVDLTNSGINMDESRSPNAINMVRNVPGKVRKRTGYRKDILFADDTLDRVVDGDTERIVQFSENEAPYTHKWKEIYKLSKPIVSAEYPDSTVQIQIKYRASEVFYFINETIKLNPSPSDTDWTELTIPYTINELETIENISILSDIPQTITIGSVSTGEAIPGKTPNYLVKHDGIDPIYGCHIAKLNNRKDIFRFDPSVVNVNRIQNAANSYPTLSRDHFTTVYSLYESIEVGTQIIIDFDYNLIPSDGLEDMITATISICGVEFLVYRGTTYGFKHFHAVVESKDRDDFYIEAKYNADEEHNVTMSFIHPSVMYAYNEATYEWSLAPEESGGSFDLSKVYAATDKNYALVETASESESGNDEYITSTLTIGDSENPVEQLAYVSLNYSVMCKRATDTVRARISLLSSTGSLFYYKQVELENKKAYEDKIELYCNLKYKGYIDAFEVEYYNEATGFKYMQITTNLSHIKICKLQSRSHYYNDSLKWYLYHVGKDFYIRAYDTYDFRKVYSDANEHISKSWQFEKNLYIIDGKEMYIYEVGEETLSPISDDKAYIPTVTIAKEPEGGGQQYEALNMLQPGFYELFQGKEDDTDYQLSFSDLDPTEVKIWLLNEDSEWVLKEEGTDFTVERATGKISFTTAPGVSPLTGEDNIKVLAYRTVEGYRDRVTKCTLGTMFGVGGAEDRLFLSGNPDYPNWDFFSGQYDPTYFPDVGYSTLGSEQSAIVGYAVINNYLATFKDGYDTSQVVFIREGDLIVNEESKLSDPAFKLINTLQGNGVISPYTFGYLQTEPIFLTKLGLYAITSQDITGEKYSQNRSFYLDGQLLKEKGLEKAVAIVFKDQYYLAINNKLYILDGMQATRTDRAEPYATRQYAGFLCDNIPATSLWIDDDVLFFGTDDGRVCYFYNDAEDINSYNDDGEPIYACWETPDLDGKLFYKNKTFRYFALRLMRAVYTSAKIYAEKLGIWSFIKQTTVVGKAFNFNDIDFTRFTFSSDTSEKLLHTKLRVKKVDKARFRVENGELNQPFGLFDLAFEFIESGNYKG